MRALALLALLLSTLARASEPSLAAFASLPADPPPPELVRGLHYWVSNEDRLDLFHAEVKDRGGVYVGVGTDQNYLLAGWARSELLVLLDFDQSVVDLHRVYRVLFREASTPEAFLQLWSKDSKPEVRRLLKEADLRPAERAAALRAHATARGAVERRLQRLLAQMQQAALPCFLTDAAQYAHLRRLYLEDKVFLVRGDLTARRTLAALGQAARQSGLTVKVLYLSNAEQYFPYGAQYRRNIRGLPMDADTRVVRTSGQRGIPRVRGTYYHYNTQAGPSFAAWLGDARTRNVLAMLKHAPPGGVRGLSRLEAGPAEARAATRQPQESFPGAPAVLPCLDAAPPGMACIPGGPFLRGTDGGRHAPAKPQARVWVQTFYMDTHEVTYGAYKACEREGRCPRAGPNYRDFDHPQQPIHGVSWYDAKAFCEAHGKRLPTEAEWEKAARGPDGKRYPWGEEPATCERAIIQDARGRSCGRKQRSRTHAEVGRPEPVGSRPPGVYGLHDMAGNAWEWVADWYTPSWKACGQACLGIDPKGPCEGREPCPEASHKVVRGGSWYWPGAYATAVYRRAHVPSNRPVFHHFGFRCAASASQAAVLSQEATSGDRNG